MSEKKLQFGFNSALSPVDKETGAFDEKGVHDTMAKKIRGHIMSQTSGDGICGMFIARFGMSVSYVTEATTEEKVVAAVNEAIAWTANQEGFFPLRGDKVPEVTLEKPREKVFTGRVAVKADFGSDLYVHPVTQELGAALREKFAEELVQLNGVRDYRVGNNWVQLVVEIKLTPADAAKAHIQELLNKHAENKESEFLPFAKGQPINIEWETLNLMD
jgi:hypothetical protein